MERTEVSYSFFKKPGVLLISGISVGILHIIGFLIYKGQFELFKQIFSDFSLFFRRFLVDRILVDALSVFILFYLTLWLGKLIAPQYPKTLKDTITYNLKYLLLILISLCIFVPLAIVIRHFWRNGLSFEAAQLVSNFRHFGRVYLQSSLPLVVVGLIVFNSTLLLKSPQDPAISPDKTTEPNKPDHLEVINENGNALIRIVEICWIERKLRTCWVRTSKKHYRIRKTLKELEGILTPRGFIRINRSTIVNRENVHNYSYWEYDKFILRMTDPENTEFIVSRKRMKQIKSQLAKDLSGNNPT